MIIIFFSPRFCFCSVFIYGTCEQRQLSSACTRIDRFFFVSFLVCAKHIWLFNTSRCFCCHFPVENAKYTARSTTQYHSQCVLLFASTKWYELTCIYYLRQSASPSFVRQLEQLNQIWFRFFFLLVLIAFLFFAQTREMTIEKKCPDNEHQFGFLSSRLKRLNERKEGKKSCGLLHIALFIISC